MWVKKVQWVSHVFKGIREVFMEEVKNGERPSTMGKLLPGRVRGQEKAGYMKIQRYKCAEDI